MHTAIVMRFPFFFAGCFAVVTGLAACSSSSGGKSAQDTFADAFCAQFEPCCAGAAMPLDGVACHAWVAQQARGAVFDQAAGDACLAAMQAQPVGADFCTNLGPTAGTLCTQVFKATSGSVPPGGACESSEDCLAPASGVAYCHVPIDPKTGAQTGTPTCRQTVWGKPGDGPCIQEQQGAITKSSWPADKPVPDVAYSCDEGTGVFCDFGGTYTCTSFHAPGEPCTLDGDQCGPDGYCQESTDTSVTFQCVATLPAGSPCTQGSSQCGASATCSASSTCVAPQPEGSACTLPEQCSFQCLHGRCVSYAENILCGP